MEKRTLNIAVQNGMTVGVLVKDEKEVRIFEGLANGKEVGDMNISLERNIYGNSHARFKKMIEIIPTESIKSNLSCREYVYMYCMLRNEFSRNIEEEFVTILEKLNLVELIEQKIVEMSYGFQVLIRSIAAYLINCKIIIYQKEIGFDAQKEKEAFSNFLRLYKSKKRGISLLFSTQMNQLEEYTDIIYPIT